MLILLVKLTFQLCIVQVASFQIRIKFTNLKKDLWWTLWTYPFPTSKYIFLTIISPNWTALDVYHLLRVKMFYLPKTASPFSMSWACFCWMWIAWRIYVGSPRPFSGQFVERKNFGEMRNNPWIFFFKTILLDPAKLDHVSLTSY